MKKWLNEFKEKDFSKMPVIVGLSFLGLAILAITVMVGFSYAIVELGLSEILPVWVLQVAVMSPWAGFIGLILLAIAACVALMILDISINKNFNEYKSALQWWKNNENDDTLRAEVFGTRY